MEEITPSSEEQIKKKKKNGKKDQPGFDKEKAKLDFFDPRGVQTLFRTLSRNHYNLLRMVDNKASIVLTMNSIIISLLMGAMLVAPDTHKDAIQLSSRILLGFSVLSMIFALISMLPHKYLGASFKRSQYNGSLYAANFAAKPLEEFQQEFKRIMRSGQDVYNEMIKDLYFLGTVIAKKQGVLLLSVATFLIGLISFVVSMALNL